MPLTREPYGFLDAYWRYMRAREHLKDLNGLIEAFKADPQDIGFHVEAESLEELLDPKLGNMRQVPIPDDIPIRIGECLYNLRASLDYLTFALAWHDTGIEPSGVWARKLQFPIESKPKVFERRRKTFLRGISDPHVAMIREYQPCEGCDWTRLLASLNDADKHRHLILLGGTFDPTSEEYDWKITWSYADAEAGERGARLPEDMHVEPRVALDIVFPDGNLVAEVLEELESEVGTLLARFATEFTLFAI